MKKIRVLLKIYSDGKILKIG